MAIDRVSSVLGSISAAGGVGLTLDDWGECVLEREGGGECVINAPPQGNAFTLSAVVGFVHQQDNETMLAALLQLNGDPERLRGGTLTLNDSREVIVYRYVVEDEGLNGPSMAALIGNFFAVADNLRKEITALRNGIDKPVRRGPSRRYAHPGYVRA